MKTNKLFLMAIFGFLAVTSCQKDTTSTDTELNYSFNVSGQTATLGASSGDSGVIAASGTNGTVSWNEVGTSISKIEFTATLNTQPINLEVVNPFGTDKVKIDSKVGTVKLNSGLYENIKIKLSYATANYSAVSLSGIYTEISGTQIPVSWVVPSQQITLEVPNIRVEKGSYTINIALELNKLLKGLERTHFGQTTRTAPNNSIVITPNLNSSLYAKLLANFPAALSVSFKKN